MDIKPRRPKPHATTQPQRTAQQGARSVDGMAVSPGSQSIGVRTAATPGVTAQQHRLPASPSAAANLPQQAAAQRTVPGLDHPVLATSSASHGAAQASSVSPGPSTELPSTQRPISQPIKKKRRLGRWLAIGCALCMTVVVGAAVAGYLWYRQQLAPIQPGSQEAVQIVVPQGATIVSATTELANKGLIKNAFAAQLYHRFEASAPLKAGVYTFVKGQAPAEMLVIMAKGESAEARITFKPGETVMDARKVLEEAGYEKKDIDQAFAAVYDKYPMMKGRPADATIEGFILGETYSYTKQFTVQNVLDRPFSLLQQLIDKEGLEAAFANQGLSLYQGIVLASIIQKEVSKPEDMALVSSVFHNRLKKNMQLGSDVTAAYGVQVQGRKTSVVEAVSIDTPYNTRIHTGLPPTPIASPGLRALRAAANPAQSDYLYFVAGDDGKTYFATTNEEHERNTKAHCDKLCKL